MESDVPDQQSDDESKQRVDEKVPENIREEAPDDDERREQEEIATFEEEERMMATQDVDVSLYLFFSKLNAKLSLFVEIIS